MACTPRSPSLRLERAAGAQTFDPGVQALDDGLGAAPTQPRPKLLPPSPPVPAARAPRAHSPLASKSAPRKPRADPAPGGEQRRARGLGSGTQRAPSPQAPWVPDLGPPRTRRPTANTPRRARLGPPQTTVRPRTPQGTGDSGCPQPGRVARTSKRRSFSLISRVSPAFFPRPRPADLLSRRAPPGPALSELSRLPSSLGLSSSSFGGDARILRPAPSFAQQPSPRNPRQCTHMSCLGEGLPTAAAVTPPHPNTARLAPGSHPRTLPGLSGRKP